MDVQELSRVMGIGIDVVDVQRFHMALERRPALKERLFTASELQEVGRSAFAERRLAARFAAKEAVLKAIGCGLRGGRWHDIEVCKDELGKPQVRLGGGIACEASRRGITQVLVSMSHEGTVATAQAVAGR